MHEYNFFVYVADQLKDLKGFSLELSKLKKWKRMIIKMLMMLTIIERMKERRQGKTVMAVNERDVEGQPR